MITKSEFRSLKTRIGIRNLGASVHRINNIMGTLSLSVELLDGSHNLTPARRKDVEDAQLDSLRELNKLA